MANRIAYHGIMGRCHLLLLGLLITVSLHAETLLINTYLKIESQSGIKKVIDSVDQTIQHDFLNQSVDLQRYTATYPLHVTLYLTEYSHKNLPKVIAEVKKLAKIIKPFTIESSALVLGNSHFLMLNVVLTPSLKAAHEATVNALLPYRDLNATIPVWAAQIPQKKKRFERYGSPNVFDEYHPHFSILYASSPSKSVENSLIHRVNAFNHDARIRADAKVTEIGVGLANQAGQIVKPLFHVGLK
jgi:hypothetical protein